MNQDQQRIVSQKIQKDAMFVQAYMAEVTSKRNMRKESIDIAAKALSFNNKEGYTADDLINTADRIYTYLAQDGELSDIKENKITTLS